MSHPLAVFLAETGDDAEAFARRVGAPVETLRAILDDGATPALALARRMAEATGGAVPIEAFFSASAVLAFDAPVTEDAPLDLDALGRAIESALLEIASEADGLRAAPMLRAAAEAVAATDAALARITTKRGARRLAQALSSVLAEILGDYGVRLPPRERILEAARRAASEGRNS